MFLSKTFRKFEGNSSNTSLEKPFHVLTEWKEGYFSSRRRFHGLFHTSHELSSDEIPIHYLEDLRLGRQGKLTFVFIQEKEAHFSTRAHF